MVDNNNTPAFDTDQDHRHTRPLPIERALKTDSENIGGIPMADYVRNSANKSFLLLTS